MSLDNAIGMTSTLKTNEKTNMVGAVNEVVDNITVANDGNYIAAGANVAENLTALDNQVKTNADHIGDVAQIQTANGNLSSYSAGGTIVNNLNALDNAIGNRSIASANTGINSALSSSISDAFVATGNAIGDVDFSSTTYAKGSGNLTGAVTSLDRAMSSMENRIDNLEDETKSGFAAMAALTGLVPSARAAGDTQLSLGTGMYRGQVGGAIGAFHYVNDNVLLNVGFSYAGNKSGVGKAGVTFSW